jgi:hypothetical protein
MAGCRRVAGDPEQGRASGYTEVDAFNDEPYAHHWFEKRVRR